MRLPLLGEDPRRFAAEAALGNPPAHGACESFALVTRQFAEEGGRASLPEVAIRHMRGLVFPPSQQRTRLP